MATQLSADGSDVENAPRNSPTLSLPSQGTVSPGDSSRPQSRDADVQATHLPDISEELSEDQQYPVRTRSNPGSSSSALEPEDIISSGSSNVSQHSNLDVDAIGTSDHSTMSSEDQQRHFTMQFEKSELQIPEAALLRPQAAPLSSLQVLEARRNFERGSDTGQHGPGLGRAQQTSAREGQAGSFGSFEIDDSIESERESHTSSLEAPFTQLHSAWSMIGGNYKFMYHHLVTGQIFRHPWKRPENPGPSSDDILKDWDAKLRSESEEVWEYVHRQTRTVIDVPPRSLPEAVIKQFNVAASHGDVPEYCQGQLHDGCLKYKISNPSNTCPRKWRTTKHPKTIEESMHKYLADIYTDCTKPAEATLLATGGQRLAVDLEDIDLNQMSGILLITDIDKALINRLIVDSPDASHMSFFIAFHFLLRIIHKDETTKELAQEVQGLYWMSVRGDNDGDMWPGPQYDIMCDPQRTTLYFGSAQYVSSRPTQGDESDVIRLSVLEVTRNLTVVLMGDVRYDWEDTTRKDHRDFVPPKWWLPSVPMYLGANQTNIRDYLARLLQVAAQDLAAIGLPRANEAETRADLEDYHDKFIAYRLVISTWNGGLEFLLRETDYFWEQAIKGPHVNDFARLKASKRYAATLHQDLGAWMIMMERLLAPETYPGGARAMNELKDLLGQISAFKQEIGDTFQLLIGAIAIKDSEIQKKLAQESKLQARRSTALTALAAIYLPLSLTTGIFGMNILEIDQGKPRYWAALAVAIGLLVATLPFLVWVYSDKDDQDKNWGNSMATIQRFSGTEQPGRDKNDSTFHGKHSPGAEPAPRDLIRRRTTRYSQMDWAVGGASEEHPNFPRRATQPETMV